MEPLSYEALYDALTIQECRLVEHSYLEEAIPRGQAERLSAAEQAHLNAQLVRLMTFIVAGERRAAKETTIARWRTHEERPPAIGSELPRERDEAYEREKTRFCLSDEEYALYERFKASQRDFGRFLQELAEKRAHYPSPINRLSLTLGQLQTLIIQVVCNAGFPPPEFPRVKLQPPMILHLTVARPTTSQDETNPTARLHRCLTSHLQQTNWRLMEDRLEETEGVLKGRCMSESESPRVILPASASPDYSDEQFAFAQEPRPIVP